MLYYLLSHLNVRLFSKIQGFGGVVLFWACCTECLKNWKAINPNVTLFSKIQGFGVVVLFWACCTECLKNWKAINPNVTLCAETWYRNLDLC
jgi:hypothetical protein